MGVNIMSKESIKKYLFVIPVVLGILALLILFIVSIYSYIAGTLNDSIWNVIVTSIVFAFACGVSAIFLEDVL